MTSGVEGPIYSVIIPTYNRPESLKRCLASIARVDYGRDLFEVIVVNDGGSESVEEQVAAFRESMNVYSTACVHSGAGGARNAGAVIARGRFLLFTADDCEPDSNWLRALDEAYSELHDRPALGGRIRNGCPENRFADASHALMEFMCVSGSQRAASHRYLTPNNLVVPADIFESIGRFDESYTLSAGEDREFCSRLIDSGHRLLYCPAAVVSHRHPLSLSGFLRMHWRYGRGSAQFHRNQADRTSGQIRLESPRYYLSALLHPMRQRGPRAALTALLVSVAQIANATGAMAEWLRSR